MAVGIHTFGGVAAADTADAVAVRTRLQRHIAVVEEAEEHHTAAAVVEELQGSH